MIRRTGSALLEILVALGILVLLAGLLVPARFQERRLARQTAASAALDRCAGALLDHWRDVKDGGEDGPHAFPRALTGLEAPEPGTVGWRGPYEGGPRPPFEYRVASGDPDLALVLWTGGNGILDSDVGGTGWTRGDWTAGGDDRYVRITTRPCETRWEAETEDRLRRVATASRAFTSRRGRLPAALVELEAERILEAADLLDPWGYPFRYEPGPEIARVSSPGAGSAIFVADRRAPLVLEPGLVPTEDGGTPTTIVFRDERGSTIRTLDPLGNLTPDEPIPLEPGRSIRVEGVNGGQLRLRTR